MAREVKRADLKLEQAQVKLARDARNLCDDNTEDYEHAALLVAVLLLGLAVGTSLSDFPGPNILLTGATLCIAPPALPRVRVRRESH
jgi:hypothetical protein